MRPAEQLSLFTRRKTPKRPPAPEFHLQCMVADVLRRWLMPGWRWTHIPLGEHRTKATAAKLKRMGVNPGWPDIILLSPLGLPHFLELKRRGGDLTDQQDEFKQWCRDRKVPHFVTDSFDAAVAQLKTWGAVRAAIST